MACLVQFQILNKICYFSIFQFCTTFLATWRNLLLTLLTVGFRVRPKTLYHSIPLHIMCAHHRSQYEIYQKSSSRERNLYYSYPWILLLMLLKYRAENQVLSKGDLPLKGRWSGVGVRAALRRKEWTEIRAMCDFPTFWIISHSRTIVSNPHMVGNERSSNMEE